MFGNRCRCSYKRQLGRSHGRVKDFRFPEESPLTLPHLTGCGKKPVSRPVRH